MRNSYSVPFYSSRLTEDEKKKYASTMMRDEFPLSVAISLGEYPCSNNCRMCPHFGHELKSRTFMDDQTYSRVIDLLPKDVDFNLEISSYGETLDHPAAVEKIAIAKTALPQAKLVVATNGISLTSKKIKGLLDSGIDYIQVSLNAGSRDTYKWLCGTDNYMKVAANLIKLVEERDKGGYGTTITTHIIEIEELRHEFESFIQDWKDLVFSAEIRGFGNWGGLIDNNECHTLRRVPEERYPCLGMWGSLKINPDGAVYKCFLHCVPAMRHDGWIGSIFEDDISTIWQGEKLEHYRLIHRKSFFNELPSCKDCKCWTLLPNIWNRAKNGNPVQWHQP